MPKGHEAERASQTSVEARYYLCLHVRPSDSGDSSDSGDTGEARRPRREAAHLPDLDERLLALCHQTTARVERIALGGGLPAVALDLGRCAADEARQVAHDLRVRLEREDWCVEAASLAPTLTLAELAVLVALTAKDRKDREAVDEVASADVNLCVITPTLAETWLRRLPPHLLARLDPARALSPAIVERLERYGLRTLGQVERLMARDPQALRRHFGAMAGAQLSALCTGRDLRALQPAAIPAVVSAHLRLSVDGVDGVDAAAIGADTDPTLAAIPALATRLARRLEAPRRDGWGGRQGRDLCLQVTWETGAITQARRRLARPLWRRTELAEAARTLLACQLSSPLASQRSSPANRGDEQDKMGAPDEWEAPAPQHILALTLTLRDLSPRPQAQPEPLIVAGDMGDARGQERLAEQERRTRLARLMVEVGAPLARRYGAPALYRLEVVRPDAILPEERLRLVRFDGHPDAERAIAEQNSRSRAGRSTRRAPALPDATDVTPPQPHWW